MPGHQPTRLAFRGHAPPETGAFAYSVIRSLTLSDAARGTLARRFGLLSLTGRHTLAEELTGIDRVSVTAGDRRRPTAASSSRRTSANMVAAGCALESRTCCGSRRVAETSPVVRSDHPGQLGPAVIGQGV